MKAGDIVAQVGGVVSEDGKHITVPAALIDNLARHQVERGAPVCCISWAASHFPAAVLNGTIVSDETFWVPCDEHRQTPPPGFTWRTLGER